MAEQYVHPSTEPQPQPDPKAPPGVDPEEEVSEDSVGTDIVPSEAEDPPQPRREGVVSNPDVPT
jgi:hypothetical protein